MLQSPNLSMTSEVERRAKSPLLEFEFAGHAMITGTNCVTKGRALETHGLFWSETNKMFRIER